MNGLSILSCTNIVKDYPGTRALDNVTAEFESGKINALLGKNGSGKSTLCKIFAGAEQATSGQFYLDGKELHFKNPLEAIAEGVVLVYQETSLVPSLSVTENIFLGRLPKKNGRVDWKGAKTRAVELLKSMDLEIDPTLPIRMLPMWQRQVVEICKALSTNPKVLILDEPTSALAKTEVECLFRAIRRIKENDVIIIYISHKLAEIHEIADTVTVLRDAQYIGKEDIQNIDNAGMIHMMFGKTEIRQRPAEVVPSDEVIMEVKGLTRAGWFEDISFKLYRGEVLGIAGVLGSGRTELLGAIFGSAPADSGEVIVGGKSYTRRSPSRMKDAGIGLTPEDRKTTGLVLMHSIESNLCYAGMKKTTYNGWVENPVTRKEMALKQMEALQIKASSIQARASSMSGGNQQKVVVGNWLNNEPTVMLYDEPTRGIDVNAKQQIFEIMWTQAKLGNSSIFVSTELEELPNVCNRILVLNNGRITGELDAEEMAHTSVNELYTLCMGGNSGE